MFCSTFQVPNSRYVFDLRLYNLIDHNDVPLLLDPGFKHPSVGRSQPLSFHYPGVALATRRQRCRDLFFGLWGPDLFMKRLLERREQRRVRSAARRMVPVVFGHVDWNEMRMTRNAGVCSPCLARHGERDDGMAPRDVQLFEWLPRPILRLCEEVQIHNF